MKFSEGEEVHARQPGTDEYQRGKILSVRGDKYKILFEPGVEHTVHQSDVRSGRASRSATRMGTRGGRKSPSRNSPSRKSPSRRSPGRSPGRTPGRSPGRSPRKSPGSSPTSTSKKLPVRSTRLAKVSLPRIEIPNDKSSEERSITTKSTNDDSPTDLMPLRSRLRESGTVTRRSMRLFSSTPKTETDPGMVMFARNINRATSLPIERKVHLHDFAIDGKERGHSVQRDQDLTKALYYEENVQLDEPVLPEKRKKEIILVSEPQEWGGWIGTLSLIFLFPLSIILPQVVCSKGQCSFDPIKIPTDIKSYISLNTLLVWTGFLTFLAFFSILPVGKKVYGQPSKIGRLQYRVNGVLCAVLSVIIFSACMYMGIRISDFILENFVQLSISGWLLGTILSVLLYIKASKASVVNLNIYASTDSTVYNFWQGREINPRIGLVDFKIIMLRASLIGMLIINLAIVIKAIERTQSLNIEHLNVALFLAASLQIFHAMDVLIFESTLLTSFEIMYEGTGYMLCTGHLLHPFLSTLTTRFILHQKPQFSYIYGIFVLCFIVGYVLYRVSNSQKDEFRRNPLSPAVAHLDTIPTSRGKKIIASGVWGYVRHPNYLGDIIMQWSVACISMARDILPYYAAICCTLALVYRALRDNGRCKLRYSLAWEEYCSRVKYMILNRIF